MTTRLRRACLALPLVLSLVLSWHTPSNVSAQVALPALESIFVDHVTSGTLFENVVKVLENRFYDEAFRKKTLPALVDQYRARAKAATSVTAQREVVFALLSNLPATHLGLLSATAHKFMMRDLQNTPYPTLGFQIIEQTGGAFAVALLEGGPAERAGLLAWDRIVSIDGTAVKDSPLLDWRSDDAYLTDERDPPMHFLTPKDGATVRLRIERHPGEFHDLSIRVESYSVFAADKASVRVIAREGRQIGYVHFWNVHMIGVPEMLTDALSKDFAACDGVVVDLRGRGGSASEIPRIINALKDDRSRRHRPLVALVDRQSRSAKDVLAYELKTQGIATVVGENTAGAVIPASFADVGYDTVLMFPTQRLPKYSDLLELKPVSPDVFVERAGPFGAGQDPILDAGVAEAIKRIGKMAWAG